MCIGGKITTVPRLFSEHLLQDENKHQIMNVHTKWNCLIPILSDVMGLRLASHTIPTPALWTNLVVCKSQTQPSLVNHT